MLLSPFKCSERIIPTLSKKIVIVFLDEILVYNKIREDHMLYLTLELKILDNNNLFTTRSKCKFECSKMEYLRYLVSTEGVKANPSKI